MGKIRPADASARRRMKNRSTGARESTKTAPCLRRCIKDFDQQRITGISLGADFSRRYRDLIHDHLSKLLMGALKNRHPGNFSRREAKRRFPLRFMLEWRIFSLPDHLRRDPFSIAEAKKDLERSSNPLDDPKRREGTR